jgi:hypothetical protein
VAVQGDVADHPSHEALIRRSTSSARSTFSSATPGSRFMNRHPTDVSETLRKTVGVNLEAGYLLSARAAAAMTRTGGKIIHIFSIRDFVPLRNRVFVPSPGAEW